MFANRPVPKSPQTLGANDDPAEIYRVHGRQVSCWTARLLGNPADVEDVVHDIFMVAFRRLDSYREELGDMGAWLHGITVRTIQARRRKQQLRRFLFLDGSADLPVAAPGASPEENVLRKQARAQLYARLERLPENQRTAFILHDIEGLLPEQIAALTETTTGNVTVRVHRARKTLQKVYQPTSTDDAEEGLLP
jgi:RNA polymerase sigma-70 factor, ECF subfamily